VVNEVTTTGIVEREAKAATGQSGTCLRISMVHSGGGEAIMVLLH
jgi:hypothetical protein